MAAVISLSFTLLLTPLFMRLFRKWGWAQIIRVPEEANNPQHHLKRGTLTMGGVIFILATVVGYFVGNFAGGTTPSLSGILVIWMMVGLGAVGFLDDWLKLRRRNSLGLSGWKKIACQLAVVTPWAIVAFNIPDANGITPASGFISIVRDVPVLNLFAFGAALGWVLYLLWINFIAVAWSNSTNVTDGLDGLATGAGIVTIAALALITFWQFQQRCSAVSLDADYLAGCYTTANPMDLTIVASAFVSALVGFLWWNAPKAKIFMGDVGSMAIGGVIASISILARIEILTVLVGGIFIIGSASVILQRVYFKATGGKRLFLMSPFHHHLEMRGWSEITIVVRMWIIAGVLAVMGGSLFYAEWLNRV